MIGLLLGGLLALAQPQPSTTNVTLTGYDSPNEKLMMVVLNDRLNPPKEAPRDPWLFPYVITGYVRPNGPPEAFIARMRVFSQDRPTSNDPAPGVMRMLLRLWDFNVTKLRIDHSEQYFNSLVDVYLCDEGRPGGEHRFERDEKELDQFGRPRRTNSIYIYDLASFQKDFLEMAREVAHEYGHATLPAAGPFSAPEDWANGPLGERLYLSWMLEELAAERLDRADTMGATTQMLQRYVDNAVMPLTVEAATKGPQPGLMLKMDAPAMTLYLGQALWAEEILPIEVFRRSLRLAADQTPGAYLDAIIAAAGEVSAWSFVPPTYVRGQAIWIPLGQGEVSGAKILRREGSWAKVQPTGGAVSIVNP